LYWA
jgi:hypothetical protein